MNGKHVAALLVWIGVLAFSSAAWACAQCDMRSTNDDMNNVHVAMEVEHQEILEQNARLSGEKQSQDKVVIAKHQELLKEHGRVLKDHRERINSGKISIEEHMDYLKEHQKMLKEHKALLREHQSIIKV